VLVLVVVLVVDLLASLAREMRLATQ